MGSSDFYINVQRNFIVNIKEGEERDRNNSLTFSPVPLLNWPSTSAHKFKYTKLCFSCRKKKQFRGLFFSFLSQRN